MHAVHGQSMRTATQLHCGSSRQVQLLCRWFAHILHLEFVCSHQVRSISVPAAVHGCSKHPRPLLPRCTSGRTEHAGQGPGGLAAAGGAHRRSQALPGAACAAASAGSAANRRARRGGGAMRRTCRRRWRASRTRQAGRRRADPAGAKLRSKRSHQAQHGCRTAGRRRRDLLRTSCRPPEHLGALPCAHHGAATDRTGPGRAPGTHGRAAAPPCPGARRARGAEAQEVQRVAGRALRNNLRAGRQPPLRHHARHARQVVRAPAPGRRAGAGRGRRGSMPGLPLPPW